DEAGVEHEHLHRIAVPAGLHPEHRAGALPGGRPRRGTGGGYSAAGRRRRRARRRLRAPSTGVPAWRHRLDLLGGAVAVPLSRPAGYSAGGSRRRVFETPVTMPMPSSTTTPTAIHCVGSPASEAP